MICLDDPASIQLWANPFSNTDSKWLRVDIAPCKGDNCKTDEEIELFLKQYSLLATVYKQQTYQPDVYDNSVIVHNYAIDFQTLTGS